jgi:hypothetical protein
MKKTVLSVRDFVILYNIVVREIGNMESSRLSFHLKEEEREKQEQEYKERLSKNPHYQDLLRIREKLGELNIEIETPNVEIEKNDR